MGVGEFLFLDLKVKLFFGDFDCVVMYDELFVLGRYYL